MASRSALDISGAGKSIAGHFHGFQTKGDWEHVQSCRSIVCAGDV